MTVHSNTIEKVYYDGTTARRRVTMVNTDFAPGDTVPEGHFWAGWKIVEVVKC